MANTTGGWGDTRRVKVFWIGEQHMVESVLLQGSALPSHILVLRIDGMPGMAKVEQVQHDPYRRAFVILISHPSFEEVQDGGFPPDVVGPCRWEWKEIPQADQPLEVGST